MRRAISPSRDPTLGPPTQARNGARNPVGLRFSAPPFHVDSLKVRIEPPAMSATRLRIDAPFGSADDCARIACSVAAPMVDRGGCMSRGAHLPSGSRAAVAEPTDHPRGEGHPARVVHRAAMRVNLVRPVRGPLLLVGPWAGGPAGVLVAAGPGVRRSRAGDDARAERDQGHLSEPDAAELLALDAALRTRAPRLISS